MIESEIGKGNDGKVLDYLFLMWFRNQQSFLRGSLLTTSAGSPARTALTKCSSWWVYLTSFVTMQPSLRSTPPSGPRKEDTLETVGVGRVIAGSPTKAGTAANCLTEIRLSFVTSDMTKMCPLV